MNLSQLDWVGLAVAGVLVIVWLVRLEGRVNGKADASTVQVVAAAVDAVKASGENMKTDIGTLHQSAKASEDTMIAVVRLQEQVKHLTNLFEKWLQIAAPPPAPSRRRRTTTVEEG